MRKLYPLMLEDIKNNYFNHKPAYFAEKYKVSKERVVAVASKLKLTNKYRWEIHKEELINDYLSGFTFRKLKKKYRHDSDHLKKFLIDNNVTLRDMSESRQIYKINQNYFENIDSHEKAYWLGFIYADGCICGKSSLQMCVAQKDIEILNKMLLSLKSNHKIVSQKNASRFTIGNKKIYTDLINLGVTPRKSLTLKPPLSNQINQKFINSFILGYFDGDGSISLNLKMSKWQLSIIGTKEICEFIQKELISSLNLNKTKIRQDKRVNVNKNTWYLVYSGDFLKPKGRENLKKLYDYLYRENIYSLKRKRDKFEYALNPNFSKKEIKEIEDNKRNYSINYYARTKNATITP